MQGPKTILAHPGRQHSHHTCLALQERSMLSRYFTVFWHGRSLFRKIEKILPERLLNELKKRHYDPINADNVRMNYRLFSKDVISRLRRKRNSHLIDRLFDQWVSRDLEHDDYDLFIGYEASALKSFRKSKALGKTCILDLASLHYSFQNKVFGAAGIDPFNGNAALREQIEVMKEEELAIADYIFAPTKFAKRTLIDGGIPEKKIITIPYGCDIKKFKGKKEYRKTGKFKILFTGLFGKRKGVQYLLQALKELDLKDAELTCIGQLSGGEEIFKKHAGEFRYIPFLHHQELAQHYQDADVFILPSILDSFGMVVLEAMACGTPVIVTENTGAKEVVREGIDGYTVPVMNVEALKEHLLTLYVNRDLAEAMGRNARSRAEQFTWKRYRQRVREALLSIQQDRVSAELRDIKTHTSKSCSQNLTIDIQQFTFIN